jgi:hypothetical protein
MERARKFYAAVLQVDIPLMDGANGDVALLPMDDDSVSADLARGENQQPGLSGVTIYLDSKGDPEGMIERAAAAGGRVLMPVTGMGDMVGFIGFFQDSEGNRIGVHKPAQG